MSDGDAEKEAGHDDRDGDGSDAVIEVIGPAAPVPLPGGLLAIAVLAMAVAGEEWCEEAGDPAGGGGEERERCDPNACMAIFDGTDDIMGDRVMEIFDGEEPAAAGTVDTEESSGR